jgi:hypothetical protein
MQYRRRSTTIDRVGFVFLYGQRFLEAVPQSQTEPSAYWLMTVPFSIKSTARY